MRSENDQFHMKLVTLSLSNGSKASLSHRGHRGTEGSCKFKLAQELKTVSIKVDFGRKFLTTSKRWKVNAEIS